MPTVPVCGSKKTFGCAALDPGTRRNKAVVSYCFGGLFTLFLVIQIVACGFRLIENPLKFEQIARGRKSTAHIISDELEHIRCIGGSLRELPIGEKVTDACKKPGFSVSAAAGDPPQGSTKTDCTAGSLRSQLNSGFHQCVNRTNHQKRTNEATNGYLLTFANGGLNQMRTAICDMVAVAQVLNATLVIPDLDHDSYWDDPSDFKDIFDVDTFIETLKDDVNIVKTLPPGVESSHIFEIVPKSWSKVSYYQQEISPLFLKHKAIRFTLINSRLANNIDANLQRLRCRANYEALRFEPELRALGNKIINRLRERGSYIALHLRYEKDMLAFSGCTVGLSEPEVIELRNIRYNTSHWKEKEINAERRRASGGCPLTPLEIGILLKGMEYPQNTTFYIAAGEIYGGKQRLEAFTSLYPNVVTKETLATPEELQPFRKFQNRLAAIDYMVALASDVFVPTFDGNMARTVEGHRRFLGHRKTLIPDRARLVKIFDEFGSRSIGWESVKNLIQTVHRNRQGDPHYRTSLPNANGKQEENFYANPLPGCICQSNSSICQGFVYHKVLYNKQKF